MSLSTGSILLVGLSVTVLSGAAIFLVSWNRPDATVPERNRSRPETVYRETIVERHLPALPPPVAEADEVIVIAEAEIAYRWQPAAPVPVESRVQYFGKVPADTDGIMLPAPATPVVSSEAQQAAIRWLLDHQHADGHWRPHCFEQDTRREGAQSPAETGSEATMTDVTAMVVIALQQVADKPRELRLALHKAETWLAARYSRHGWIDRNTAHNLLTQALVALALQRSSNSEALIRSTQAMRPLTNTNRLKTGWPRFDRDKLADPLVTLLAAEATHLNQQRTVRSSDGHRETRRLSFRSLEGFADTPFGLWTAASEEAQQVARAGLFDWTAEGASRGAIDRKLLRVLYDTTDAGVDLTRCWLTAMLFDRVERDREPWAIAVREQLQSSQMASGNCEYPHHYGSWRPDESLAQHGGRVAATAMALYSLSVIQNARLPEPNHDADKDSTPDSADEALSVPTIGAGAPMLFAMRGNNVRAVLPLQHTAVRARISGHVVSADCTQTYTNPYDENIEVVFCFPLPHQGTITDFTLTYAGRTVRGIVRPRQEAEKAYTEAIERGQTAALLNRETAGVFNHYIGNIAPGTQLDVAVSVFQHVNIEHGLHEWVMPLVVGPWYIAGSPQEQTDQPGNRVRGHGVARDTHRVPNASRVTPPTLPEGVTSPNRVSVEVDLAAAGNVTQLVSLQHEVVVSEPAPNRRLVKLKGPEVADRDFILRWRTDGEATLLAHRADGDGWFSLNLSPPAVGLAGPREFTFIIDVSGSMSGAPIQCCHQLVEAALALLRPDDYFNIVYFSGSNGQVFAAPVEATPANTDYALRQLRSIPASGGTEMLAGLQRAIETRHNEQLPQTFVLLTDGYVGETEGILHLVDLYGDRATFFAFGVGQSVNRELVDGVARSGNGRAIYYVPEPGVSHERAVEAALSSMRGTAAELAGLAWGNLPVHDVTRHQSGATYTDQVLTLTGRYTAPATGTLTATWRLDGVEQITTVAINLPALDPGNPALPKLWAAARIRELESRPMDEAVQKQLVDLSVRHSLATRWTSYVAIDQQSMTTGDPVTVVQPVELPKGVSRAGVGR